MKGDKELATEKYKLSLEHKPDRIKTYVHYAIFLRDRWDRPDEADAIVALMVKVNETSAEAWTAMAEYCMRNDRNDEAADSLAKARELAPDDANVLLLSSRYVEKSDPKACEDYLKKCLELHPQEARAYYQLATLALDADDSEQAMEIVDKGLEAIPNNVPLLTVKADMALIKGDRDSAVATIRKIQVRPHEPGILGYLSGRLAMLDGDYEQAAGILEHVLPQIANRNELRAQANLLIAECYRRLERGDRAEEAFKRVLEDDPKNEKALEGLKNGAGLEEAPR